MVEQLDIVRHSKSEEIQKVAAHVESLVIEVADVAVARVFTAFKHGNRILCRFIQHVA